MLFSSKTTISPHIAFIGKSKVVGFKNVVQTYNDIFRTAVFKRF